MCGGGRLNRALMAGLAAVLPDVEVKPVEGVGWRGDALEAEAFGYLAVRSLKGLRDPEAFDAWVHKITVRVASRAIAKRERHGSAQVSLEVAPDAWDVRAEELDLDYVLSARASLVAALARLPVRQRLALTLRYVHDLSDEELAAALGCRIGTVHALLSRGRNALRADPSLGCFMPVMEDAAA